MFKKETLYIVSYDISNDRLRNKVADTLKNFGKRVQYSVFECRLTDSRYKTMYLQLMQLSVKENGNIHLYPICENCASKIQIIGSDNRKQQRKERIIII